MEPLLVLIGWILGLALLASPVLAWIAYARSRQVLDLRTRLEALERRVARGREEGASPPALPARPARPTDPAPTSERKRRAEPSLEEELAAAPPAPRETVSERERSRAHERAEAMASAITSPPPSRDSGSAPADAPSDVRPARESASVDWERWLGVRGAAVVGGISLALAGLFFFQYAIAHGWFGPAARILTGSLAGIACLAAKSRLHRKGYGVLSDVLAGAGTVLLYGAAWASYRLYEFVPLPASFAWMAAVTVIAGVLAARYDSQVIALFGLVGGFATPLLLSSGENRPFSLFGYILLLDLGLLALSRRKGWPLLGALGLVGTAVVQGLWILLRMEPGQAWLGLVVLGLFGALFVAAGPWKDEDRAERWIASQVGGLVVPFLFAFWFALEVEMGPHLWPLGLLLALLLASAGVVGRRHGSAEMPLGAALAAAGVSLAWTLRNLADVAGTWELAGVGAGLTAVLAATTFGQVADGGPRPWFRRPQAATAVGALAFLAVLFVAATEARFDLELAPLATGAAALAVLALVTDREGALRALPVALGLGVGCVLAVVGYERSGFSWVETPGALAWAAVLVAFAAAGLAASFVPRDARFRMRLALSAAAVVLPALLVLEPWSEGAPARYAIVVFLLAATGAKGAARAGSSLAYGALVAAGVFALARWNAELSREEALVSVVGSSLAWQAATLAALAWIPTLGRALYPERRWVLRAAAFAPVLWAVPVNWLAVDGAFVGDTVPVQLAALAAIAGVGALGAVVPHGFAAAGLASFALARWIGVEWLPLGAAFTGLASFALARALPHPQRRASHAAFACSALALAGLGLLLVALDGGHFVRADAIVWNEIAFAYLVGGAALLVGAVVAGRLEDFEVGRVTSAHVAAALGSLAVLVVFAGLNLLVLNAYGEGPRVRFEWGRVQDRDLVQSLVWGLYAVLLLVIGTVRSIGGLRWLSLGFLVATIAKVFLYDLGELTGLYRAGSMMGLAICLLGVSWLYQRFVLRRDPQPRGTPAE